MVHSPDTTGDRQTLNRCGCAVAYNPRFDIAETDDQLLLYGDMPGVAPDNLEVRFADRELTIIGTVEPRQENTEYLHNEYGVGDFRRCFRIAETIDAAKISAELKNGVLTVHLPKREELKPRRIEIRA